MKQMIARQVSIVRPQMDPELVDFGFARDDEGRIFLFQVRGWEVLTQPVLEDGTIARAENFLFPGELVDLVDPGSLGIAGIRYAPEGTDVL